MVVCHAAQAPHCEYIDRKNKECNFHTYVTARSLAWVNQIFKKHSSMSHQSLKEAVYPKGLRGEGHK